MVDASLTPAATVTPRPRRPRTKTSRASLTLRGIAIVYVEAGIDLLHVIGRGIEAQPERIRDLPIDDFSREKMNATLKELEEERAGVAALLG